MVENHQWSLESEDGMISFLFGTKDTGIQTASAPDLGNRAVRKRVANLPREDGTGRGAEFEDGTIISFDADVMSDYDDWEGQSDLLNEFRAAWSRREFRAEPGNYAILKSCEAGRVRRCYGRPGRFAEADGDNTHRGLTPVVAEFETFDGRFYDDEPQGTVLGIRPPTSFGFTTPIVVTGVDPNTVAFQTDTLEADEQPGSVIVETETWPWVEIHGPVTSPLVELGDLTIELDYTIPDGMSVLLDPRPWSRRVIRSDGANLAGKLTWQTPPMGEWVLKPGSYPLVYRGIDPTGSSFVSVNWREAFHRP